MLGVRPWAAQLIGVAAYLLQPRPSAAREPFELSWSAPAGCPSADEVSAALARLAAAGSRVEAASVEIVPVAGRWQATLSTRGAQRRLEGESCEAVVQALTVVLALAAEEAEQSAAPAAAPPPTTTQRIEVKDTAPAAPLAAESGATAGQPALGWGMRCGVFGEIGMLPAPSLGPELALQLHFGAWSLELAGSLLIPRHARLQGGLGTPESDIDWLGGQLAACRVLYRPLLACLGLESGRLAGAGVGVDQPASARGWWLAGTAGLRLQGAFAPRSAWSWLLGLGASAALARPEFGFDGLGVLHRPSSVSGRLFLGLGWAR